MFLSNSAEIASLPRFSVILSVREKPNSDQFEASNVETYIYAYVDLVKTGDGSKVVMVVHISPSKDDVGETICSLGFAKRARLIESCRELSEVR